MFLSCVMFLGICCLYVDMYSRLYIQHLNGKTILAKELFYFLESEIQAHDRPYWVGVPLMYAITPFSLIKRSFRWAMRKDRNDSIIIIWVDEWYTSLSVFRYLTGILNNKFMYWLIDILFSTTRKLSFFFFTEIHFSHFVVLSSRSWQ